MKHIGSILFSLCLLFLVGCADEIGPFDSGDPSPAPVFTFNGLVNGDSVQMTAGDNGYRMSTSRLQDTLAPNGTLLRGEMHDPDCPGCEPEFRVNLFHRPENPMGAIPDSAFEAGSVVMNPPPSIIPNTRTIEFNYQGPTGGPATPVVSWDFGDGSAAQGLSVQHTYDLTSADSVVAVFCTVLNSGFCTSINFVNLWANHILEVDVQQNGSGGGNNTVQVSIDPVLGNQGLLIVDMGDGTNPIVGDWTFNYTYSAPGIYSMAVQYLPVDSANFFVYQREIHVGPQLICNAAFNYRELPLPLPPGPPTREAILTYDAPNGERYTSAPIFGGTQQTLEILNHTPYKDNEHGDLVYIVDMEFTGWLYRVGGQDSIYVEDAVLQWGLPY
ncbi:hypothetical protein HZ996_02970 [Cryomorphaceae bacterium]|nr:hypothetical protein HZ996_02970 [Cryomorphaceae bacterium]